MKTKIYFLLLKATDKKNLTLSEFANYMPMSKSSFYSVLRGEKKLTLQEANTISGELDISLDEIASAELNDKS